MMTMKGNFVIAAIIAAAFSLTASYLALAQQPVSPAPASSAPGAAEMVVKDWQILGNSKAAQDGALDRLQMDLSALLRENAKLKADLAEAQKAKAASPVATSSRGMSPR